MDICDVALQASCPVIAAPRFGELPDMANGQRIIVAANGLFVQVRLDWLDCIQRLTPDAPAMRLPYGVVQERLKFSFGRLPILLIETFVEAGRQQLPNEVAGALIYSRQTGALRFALCESLHASPGQVRYTVPPMEAEETIAVDLHTHGSGMPFWSADDDRDDQGIKIAGVFGCLHQTPRAAFRLVMNGMYRPLAHPWQGQPDPAHEDDSVETGFMRRILTRWRGATNERRGQY
jgi:PRTRC genetic system protein A